LRKKKGRRLSLLLKHIALPLADFTLEANLEIRSDHRPVSVHPVRAKRRCSIWCGPAPRDSAFHPARRRVLTDTARVWFVQRGGGGIGLRAAGPGFVSASHRCARISSMGTG